MNPSVWVGLGFVATAENCSPDIVKSMGSIKTVAPQICWGLGYPSNDPDGSHTRNLLTACKTAGLGVAGWAWCNDWARATDEARYHAGETLELGLGMFIANMEEPYDAHGDQSNPKMWAPDEYAQAFRSVAPQVEFAVTTTPRWASSGNGLRDAGACMMPQAFTGEVPDATIPACVSHAQAWGWTTDRIRPLVQVYQTNGTRPDPGVYNQDSASCQVGVSPYILEQAFDSDGMSMIKTLGPSIARPPAAITPPPAPAPDLPFARALYPPDSQAKGKTPSTPGPDIEAVRRAVSRAGYAPWPQSSQQYDNGFSHGPMEQFQAEHVDLKGKPPSGWYGSASHEALRCFVIPSGPNQGQFAFDAYSQELYLSA